MTKDKKMGNNPLKTDNSDASDGYEFKELKDMTAMEIYLLSPTAIIDEGNTAEIEDKSDGSTVASTKHRRHADIETDLNDDVSTIGSNHKNKGGVRYSLPEEEEEKEREHQDNREKLEALNGKMKQKRVRENTYLPFTFPKEWPIDISSNIIPWEEQSFSQDGFASWTSVMSNIDPMVRRRLTYDPRCKQWGDGYDGKPWHRFDSLPGDTTISDTIVSESVKFFLSINNTISGITTDTSRDAVKSCMGRLVDTVCQRAEDHAAAAAASTEVTTASFPTPSVEVAERETETEDQKNMRLGIKASLLIEDGAQKMVGEDEHEDEQHFHYDDEDEDEAPTSVKDLLCREVTASWLSNDDIPLDAIDGLIMCRDLVLHKNSDDEDGNDNDDIIDTTTAAPTTDDTKQRTVTTAATDASIAPATLGHRPLLVLAKAATAVATRETSVAITEEEEKDTTNASIATTGLSMSLADMSLADNDDKNSPLLVPTNAAAAAAARLLLPPSQPRWRQRQLGCRQRLLLRWLQRRQRRQRLRRQADSLFRSIRQHRAGDGGRAAGYSWLRDARRHARHQQVADDCELATKERSAAKTDDSDDNRHSYDATDTDAYKTNDGNDDGDDDNGSEKMNALDCDLGLYDHGDNICGLINANINDQDGFAEMPLPDFDDSQEDHCSSRDPFISQPLGVDFIATSNIRSSHDNDNKDTASTTSDLARKEEETEVGTTIDTGADADNTSLNMNDNLPIDEEFEVLINTETIGLRIIEVVGGRYYVQKVLNDDLQNSVQQWDEILKIGNTFPQDHSGNDFLSNSVIANIERPLKLLFRSGNGHNPSLAIEADNADADDGDSGSGRRYDVDRLISKLVEKCQVQKNGGSFFDWHGLGIQAGLCFNAAPSNVSFLNGPLLETEDSPSFPLNIDDNALIKQELRVILSRSGFDITKVTLRTIRSYLCKRFKIDPLTLTKEQRTKIKSIVTHLIKGTSDEDDGTDAGDDNDDEEEDDTDDDEGDDVDDEEYKIEEGDDSNNDVDQVAVPTKKKKGRPFGIRRVHTKSVDDHYDAVHTYHHFFSKAAVGKEKEMPYTHFLASETLSSNKFTGTRSECNGFCKKYAKYKDGMLKNTQGVTDGMDSYNNFTPIFVVSRPRRRKRSSSSKLGGRKKRSNKP